MYNISVCICICIYVYISIYIYMYIHLYDLFIIIDFLKKFNKLRDLPDDFILCTIDVVGL